MLFVDRRRPSRKALLFFFALKPRSGFTEYILITVMHEYISFLKVETASPITSPSHLAFCEITHLFAFFEFPHLHTGQHSAGQQRPVPVSTLVMRARSQQGSPLLKHLFETLQEAAHGGHMKLALSELNRPDRRSYGSCKPPPERKR